MNKFAATYQFAINLFVFLFGALMITIKSGYSYGPFFLCLMALPYLFIPKTYQLSKQQKLYLLSVFIYTAVLLLSILVDKPIYEKSFEIPARLLGSLIIFLLLYQYNISFNAIIYGIVIGAFCACIIAVYEKFHFNVERAFTISKPTYVIQAGNISMSLGLLCLCISTYFYQKKQYIHFTLFLIGCLAGVSGSLLSGTRGGWIFLPVILVVFYQMSKPVFGHITKWIGACIITVVILFAAIPQTGVQQRIISASQDIKHYSDQTNKNTSLGIRFQLWQSAWDSFLERPVFGWGEQGIEISHKKQLKEKLISGYIYNFNTHAHNEYFNEMALRGSIGLLALLGIFFIPLYLFRKAFITHQNSEIKTIAMAGVIIILSVIDYGFSQAFLKHNSGVMFYFCMLAIFMAFCYPKQQTSSQA